MEDGDCSPRTSSSGFQTLNEELIFDDHENSNLDSASSHHEIPEMHPQLVTKNNESWKFPRSKKRICFWVVVIFVLLFGTVAGITFFVKPLTTKADATSFSETELEAGKNDSLSSQTPTLVPSTSDVQLEEPSSSHNPNDYPSFEEDDLGPGDDSMSPSPTTIPTSRKSPHSSEMPSFQPTNNPTWKIPSVYPSRTLSKNPSRFPSVTPTFVSYVPGLLTSSAHGLKISQGLSVRLLATTGIPVLYDTGGSSSELFHVQPDFGATFPDTRAWNLGGWIYVNNAENRTHFDGGVGALTFDAQGRVIDYRSVLTKTRANCGGGKTEWGAWISCEEFPRGRNWQVDPTGERPAAVISLGSDGGQFESFAHDTRNTSAPFFFVTEDALDGALQRWRPFAPDWSDPWNILLGPGETDFLVLHPDASGTSGTFDWTKNRTRAKLSATVFYPNCEGIEFHQGRLLFISKRLKLMITLNLDKGSYRTDSTRSGLFNGGPDQVQRIMGKQKELLYFTEDSNQRAGIHARDSSSRFFTILETETHESETTGLAFSPDHKAMYFAYQDEGVLFEARRLDGLAFGGTTLNVQFHSTT